MRRTVMAIAAAILLAGVATVAKAEDDPTGRWIMENGKVTVQLSRCGGGLCGRIVGLAKPLDKKGRPKVDKENPNPSLRSRPLIGLTILSGMQAEGDNTWSGSIYNADDGRTYSSTMHLAGNRMKVKGCVVFICKSMAFRKVD